MNIITAIIIIIIIGLVLPLLPRPREWGLARGCESFRAFFLSILGTRGRSCCWDTGSGRVIRLPGLIMCSRASSGPPRAYRVYRGKIGYFRVGER